MDVMTLHLLVPGRLVPPRPCRKLRGQASYGSFTLLPRHLDGLIALSAGLMRCTDGDGRAIWLAVDEGLLVKQGRQVTIMTPRYGEDSDPEQLAAAVQSGLLIQDEHERRARAAMAGMEASLVRGLVRMEVRP
jgi:F-type H+-transporting ATPase subunit epsilon